MATKKSTQKPSKSGYNAPVYGETEKIPEGYVAKKDKDGVVRYVKKEKK